MRKRKHKINRIQDIWNRLSCEATLRGVSFEINRLGDGYTDAVISQTTVLADGFGMDPDEDVTDTPAHRHTSMAEELAAIL